jgi:hypothetical protein
LPLSVLFPTLTKPHFDLNHREALAEELGKAWANTYANP